MKELDSSTPLVCEKQTNSKSLPGRIGVENMQFWWMSLAV